MSTQELKAISRCFPNELVLGCARVLLLVHCSFNLNQIINTLYCYLVIVLKIGL